MNDTNYSPNYCNHPDFYEECDGEHVVENYTHRTSTIPGATTQTGACIGCGALVGREVVTRTGKYFGKRTAWSLV